MTGPVVVVFGPKDIDKVKEGMVLVAPETTPDFIAAMSKAAAFVTDCPSVGVVHYAPQAVTITVVAISAAGFPGVWTSAFSLSAAAITLVMVFVIQHTQSREQTATQLKLDELIRALPQADDHLVHVEAAQDEELADLERRQTAHHESLRADRTE